MRIILFFVPVTRDKSERDVTDLHPENNDFVYQIAAIAGRWRAGSALITHFDIVLNGSGDDQNRLA